MRLSAPDHTAIARANLCANLLARPTPAPAFSADRSSTPRLTRHAPLRDPRARAASRRTAAQTHVAPTRCTRPVRTLAARRPRSTACGAARPGGSAGSAPEGTDREAVAKNTHHGRVVDKVHARILQRRDAAQWHAGRVLVQPLPPAARVAHRLPHGLFRGPLRGSFGPDYRHSKLEMPPVESR
jgi:hypothetical protein